ncbi:hypothetical protein [Streptomyces sp. NPDC002763]|uniref:hypothetical protein n=1 Tax=Streptomyces sp. NPDC002763 TaxID=3154427 RepID=UPI0033303FB4
MSDDDQGMETTDEENRMADVSKSSRMKQWASAFCDVLGDLAVGYAGGAMSS